MYIVQNSHHKLNTSALLWESAITNEISCVQMIRHIAFRDYQQFPLLSLTPFLYNFCFIRFWPVCASGFSTPNINSHALTKVLIDALANCVKPCVVKYESCSALVCKITLRQMLFIYFHCMSSDIKLFTTYLRLRVLIL